MLNWEDNFKPTAPQPRWQPVVDTPLAKAYVKASVANAFDSVSHQQCGDATNKRIPNGLTEGERRIVNRRATQIGLEALYPNEENPSPWMSQMIDVKKQRGLFETRVIECQSGGALSWD